MKQVATTLVWDGFDYLGEVNPGSFDFEKFTVDRQSLVEKCSGTESLDFERTAHGSVCTKYDQTNQARARVQRYKSYGSLEFHDSTLTTWQCNQRLATHYPTHHVGPELGLLDSQHFAGTDTWIVPTPS